MGNILQCFSQKYDIDEVLKNHGKGEKKYTFEELNMVRIDFLEREAYLDEITKKYNVKWKDWSEGIACPDGKLRCGVWHGIVKGVIFWK